jgi:hypothetical protein
VIHRRTLVLATASVLPARFATAALVPPRGPAILIVDGKITQRNGDTGARFDMAMLDSLQQGRFFGETPWTRGTLRFTGPRLPAPPATRSKCAR